MAVRSLVDQNVRKPFFSGADRGKKGAGDRAKRLDEKNAAAVAPATTSMVSDLAETKGPRRLLIRMATTPPTRAMQV